MSKPNSQTAALTLLLASPVFSCDSNTEITKARSNEVAAWAAGVRVDFKANSRSLCSEIPLAETPLVPPIDKKCSRGCTCKSSNANGNTGVPATTYNCEDWSAREWKLLHFAGMYTLDETVNPKVYFHYKAKWNKTEAGCVLAFTVHGDLDEDGVYSTYVSTVRVDQNGAVGDRPDVSVLWE